MGRIYGLGTRRYYEHEASNRLFLDATYITPVIADQFRGDMIGLWKNLDQKKNDLSAYIHVGHAIEVLSDFSEEMLVTGELFINIKKQCKQHLKQVMPWTEFLDD